MDKTVEEFQRKYPTKEEKIKALQKMTDEEIDVLINGSTSVYGKFFYSQFKKGARK